MKKRDGVDVFFWILGFFLKGLDRGVHYKSDVAKYLKKHGFKKCIIGNCVEIGGNNRYWNVYDKKMI